MAILRDITDLCPDEQIPALICYIKNLEENIESLIRDIPTQEGVAGAQGPAGQRGETGDPGIQGIPGDRGDPGIQGIPGDIGPSGERGQQGDQGDPGIQGIPGLQGIPGNRGPQGQQGEIGPIGPTGPTGDQAALDAFEASLPDLYINYRSGVSSSEFSTDILEGEIAYITDFSQEEGSVRVGVQGQPYGISINPERCLFNQTDNPGTSANRAAFEQTMLLSEITGTDFQFCYNTENGSPVYKFCIKNADEITNLSFNAPVGFDTNGELSLGIMPSLQTLRLNDVGYDSVGDNWFSDALSLVELMNNQLGLSDIDILFSQLPDRTGLTQGSIDLTGNLVVTPIDLSVATNKNWTVIGITSI